MKEITFYSHERQDEFAYNLIGDSGFFIGLGCSSPITGSNTLTLETVGWQGICYNIRDCELAHNWSNFRKTKFVQVDATIEKFYDLLCELKKEHPVVDYISIDIDTAGQSFSLLGHKIF